MFVKCLNVLFCPMHEGGGVLLSWPPLSVPFYLLTTGYVVIAVVTNFIVVYIYEFVKSNK